jgi:hypothetical protein
VGFTGGEEVRGEVGGFIFLLEVSVEKGQLVRLYAILFIQVLLRR